MKLMTEKSAIMYVAVLAICTFATHSLAGDYKAWVDQLDSDSYEQRESATISLGKAGEEALPALMAAANNGSGETKWRAYRAIRLIVKKDKKLQAKTIAQSRHVGIDWLAAKLAPRPVQLAPQAIPVFSEGGGMSVLGSSSSTIVIRSTSIPVGKSVDYGELMKLIEATVEGESPKVSEPEKLFKVDSREKGTDDVRRAIEKVLKKNQKEIEK